MTERADRIKAILEGLNTSERAIVEMKLKRIITQRQALARFPTPGHLAKFLNPETIQTPLMDALDQVIMQADAGMNRRIIINTPPQEGKTQRCTVAGLWMLMRNQRRRIVYASYEEGIASRAGLQIRQWIETHGAGYRNQKGDPDREDVLGLLLDPAHAQQTKWKLAATTESRAPGGVVSVGVGGALTGRAADVVFIDDPLKNAAQARSPVYRKAVIDWFQSVVLTRLPPSAIVIVVQTRWDEGDLTGWLQTQDQTDMRYKWHELVVRAQAEADDPLGREPGEWLISTRDRTPEDWAQVRRAVGEVWWAALYQQRPAPAEGGIFKREWFERDRVLDPPELVHAAVFVDPADNEGEGDEAGIIVGGIGADGDIYVMEDLSGHFTVAAWTRQSIFALIRYRASVIRFERSLSRLAAHIRSEWKLMRVQARALQLAWEEIQARLDPDAPWTPSAMPAAIRAAAESLSADHDSAHERKALMANLAALWRYVPAILDMPSSGPRVQPITPQGNKTYRAEMVAPLYENRRVHHVGQLAKLEHQMATWLPPADSPDRMDAAVYAVTEMDKLSASAGRVNAPTGVQIPTRHLSQTIKRTTSRR